MSLRYLPLLVFSLLLGSALGGFIRTHSLANLNYTEVALDPFIIFVTIDMDNKLMKFLINTQVIDAENSTTTRPVVTDVDFVTNRYTTLHVEIDFMGKTFINENLRFCDILAVKNTSSTDDTYRFNGLSSATSSTDDGSATGSPDIPGHKHPSNGSIENYAVQVDTTGINLNTRQTFFNNTPVDGSMATSNSSVEALFSNSTGDLIQCPLYVNDSIAFYYQADVSSNYQNFGSYSVRFTVVSNNENSDVIGGAMAYVTSSAKSKGLETLLFYGVLSIVVCACVMHFMIIVSSPDQESQNPFLIEASAICNEGLLKQLEAHPLTLMSYLQFALFMSGLNISYPGFFQYLMGRIDWCALLSINVLHRWTSLPSPESDNVYMTYYSGLKSLAQYSDNGFTHYSWPNFIVCFLIWTFCGMAGYQIFILLKSFSSSTVSPSFLRNFFGHRTENSNLSVEKDSRNSSFRYSLTTNMWALLGHILRDFLNTFGFPFLVLTIYMLFIASSLSDTHGEMIELTEANAFGATVPYDTLNPYHIGCLFHGSKSKGVNNEIHNSNPEIPIVSVVFGVITLAAWILSALFFLYYYISPISVRGHEKQNVTKLYTSVKAIVTWAFLYNAYKPSKVYYVAVDLFGCIFESIVIAALQNYGIEQVALMVVIEFAKFVLLFTVRPLFLKMSWHSLPVIMQTSRLIVTVLNIPYLRQLNVSEASRTYVSYVQMLLHCIVAVAYVLHLIYCLAITITAAVKSHRATSSDAKSTKEDANVEGSGLFDEFEFKQVSMQRAALFEKHQDKASTSSSLDDGEVDYYRSKSERILRNMESRGHQSHSESEAGADDSSLDYRQAENRIRETDYTTREADRIYYKYFSADEMDPEMKALWESRDWNNNIKPLQAKGENSSSQKGVLAKVWAGLRPEKKKGFEVVRRRPIIVTQTVANVDEAEDSEQDT